MKNYQMTELSLNEQEIIDGGLVLLIVGGSCFIAGCIATYFAMK